MEFGFNEHRVVYFPLLYCMFRVMYVCAGATSRVWFAAMDQEQSAAGSDGQRGACRHGHRIHSASLQPQRRNDHAAVVPGRRADANAEDDHPASHHIKSHRRYSS